MFASIFQYNISVIGPLFEDDIKSEIPLWHLISSFENIVEDNFLYFDKTQTIERMEKLGSYLKIWRPRRSGKSLFCDQLALYYDKGAAENSVFEHTYIGANPTPNKSKYLVLFLSFSNVDTTGDLRENFRDHINARILDFSKRYKMFLKEDIEISQNHIRSMENLFSAVEMAKEKLYLIVDEYDSFANRLLLEVDTSSADLGRNQYLATVADKESMLRNFGNVLKSATRTVLRRMFFTGVAPMAFSDGLSSLNMVEDVSSSKFFESQFGFTEEEVTKGLGGHPRHPRPRHRRRHLRPGGGAVCRADDGIRPRPADLQGTGACLHARADALRARPAACPPAVAVHPRPAGETPAALATGGPHCFDDIGFSHVRSPLGSSLQPLLPKA
eukprot:gene36048-48507_t